MGRKLDFWNGRNGVCRGSPFRWVWGRDVSAWLCWELDTGWPHGDREVNQTDSSRSQAVPLGRTGYPGGVQPGRTVGSGDAPMALGGAHLGGPLVGRALHVPDT